MRLILRWNSFKILTKICLGIDNVDLEDTALSSRELYLRYDTGVTRKSISAHWSPRSYHIKLIPYFVFRDVFWQGEINFVISSGFSPFDPVLTTSTPFSRALCGVWPSLTLEVFKTGSKVEISEVIYRDWLPPKNYQKSTFINSLSTIQSNQSVR